MNKDCYNKTPDDIAVCDNCGKTICTVCDTYTHSGDGFEALVICQECIDSKCAEGKTGCDTDEHVLCALCEKPMCLLHSHHEMWDGEQVCAECIAIPEEEEE